MPVDEVRKIYEQVRQGHNQPDRIALTEYEPCEHETPPGMYAEALDWFRRWAAK